MPSRNINDCVPELQEAWPKLKAMFEKKWKGWTLVLACTHRTPEEQFEEFKKGREKQNGKWVVTEHSRVTTNRDGDSIKSLHNFYPAKAFDVALVNPQGKTYYVNDVTADQWWSSLGPMADKLNLVWGGSWASIVDGPHFQIKK
jgi:hypothetical protein